MGFIEIKRCFFFFFEFGAIFIQKFILLFIMIMIERCLIFINNKKKNCFELSQSCYCLNNKNTRGNIYEIIISGFAGQSFRLIHISIRCKIIIIWYTKYMWKPTIDEIVICSLFNHPHFHQMFRIHQFNLSFACHLIFKKHLLLYLF